MDKLHSRVTDFKAEDLLHVSNIQGNRFRSVFRVNFKHVYTVGQLKKVIASRHGLSVVSMSYRGVLLEEEQKLVLLIPDFHDMGAPRFSVRTREHSLRTPGGMSLQVKGLKDSYFVHVRAESTVADLVTAIVNYEAYASDQDIQITCAGMCLSALDSSLTLSECKVASRSVVHVSGKLRGGQSSSPATKFVDMENLSALKTGSVSLWQPGMPRFNLISPGLNLKGKCRNAFCEAFGETVVSREHFSVFNIAQAVQCPACDSDFTATTVTFYQCQWMFEGRKAGAMSIDIMSKWFTTSGEDKCEYFDDKGGANVAEWSNLVITAKPLPDNDVGKGLKNVKLNTDCSICFGTLTTGSPISRIIDMACGHRAHSVCGTALQQCGYTKCPTCRDPIAA